jgi:hypothetical protein
MDLVHVFVLDKNPLSPQGLDLGLALPLLLEQSGFGVSRCPTSNTVEWQERRFVGFGDTMRRRTFLRIDESMSRMPV